MQNPAAADRWHIAAKSWASGARRAKQSSLEGQEDAIKKSFEYAVEYELKALKILLNYPYASETLVLDCYKFAAVYALEAENPHQAIELLKAVLERDPPEPLRRELVGLLQDANTSFSDARKINAEE